MTSSSVVVFFLNLSAVIKLQHHPVSLLKVTNHISHVFNSSSDELLSMTFLCTLSFETGEWCHSLSDYTWMMGAPRTCAHYSREDLQYQGHASAPSHTSVSDHCCCCKQWEDFLLYLNLEFKTKYSMWFQCQALVAFSGFTSHICTN